MLKLIIQHKQISLFLSLKAAATEKCTEKCVMIRGLRKRTKIKDTFNVFSVYCLKFIGISDGNGNII